MACSYKNVLAPRYTCVKRGWEQIKLRIYFNDNTHLAESNDKIAMPQKVFVGEQMIPYKGYHSIKHYLQVKPKKWWYEAFVLCASDESVYNWELFCRLRF